MRGRNQFFFDQVRTKKIKIEGNLNGQLRRYINFFIHGLKSGEFISFPTKGNEELVVFLMMIRSSVAAAHL